MNKTILRKTKKVKLSHTRHAGDKRERRYSSNSFVTSALDGGEWSASRPGRVLPPGKYSRYPLTRRQGGPHRRSGHRLEEKSFISAGHRTIIARPDTILTELPGSYSSYKQYPTAGQTLYWLSYPAHTQVINSIPLQTRYYTDWATRLILKL
jgi:hypothetical protein